MTAYEAAGRAADRLTSLVMEKVGAKDRNEVQCPREKSFMTPCVARDGHTAVADDGVCVGCGHDPIVLLGEARDRAARDVHDRS